MKRVNKILCVLAMVIILCMTMMPLANAAESGNLWLSVAPSDSGTAALILTDTTITDGLIKVTYDPAKLTYQDVVVSSAYVSVHSVNAEQAGILLISWVAPNAYTAGDSAITLIRINFTGTDGASLEASGEAHGPEGVVVTLNVRDLSELEAAIKAAEVLSQDSYTQDSWAALESALDEAKAILADATASPDQVDAAAKALKAAMEALVNIDELAAAVKAAEALKEEDYTVDTWAALKAALDAAKATLADTDATQAQVDAAAKTLKEAMSTLGLRVYLAELEAAIKAAEALKEADYTAESWAPLKAALVAARATLADPDATQAQVDAAAKALKDAANALVRLVDTSALEAAIQVAKQVNKANYTEESYKAMQEALQDAEAVLADEAHTQAQVDAATKALKDAINSLVKLPNSNPGTGDDTPVAALIAVLVLTAACIGIMLMLNKRDRKRFLAFVLALCLVSALGPRFDVNAFGTKDLGFEKLDPSKWSDALGRNPNLGQIDTVKTPAPDEAVKVIIFLEEQSVIQSNPHAVLNAQTQAQMAALEKEQNQLLGRIQSLILKDTKLEVSYQYTWLVNGIAATVPYGSIDAIRALDGVKSVILQQVYTVCKTADPNTVTDGVMIGREPTWANGYTGEGMKIAIIDTGLDIDHPNFAALPQEKLTEASATTESVAAVLGQLNASGRFNNLTAEDVYYSTKVAFGFNYCDDSLDITHDFDTMGDHGTHVAGIAAANKIDASEVVGVAPDAQLYVMKVFGKNGGAYTMDILAALEDALLLGADVINMSLGSPAGFTSGGQTEMGDPLDPVYDSIATTGTIVSVSAGNNYTSGLLNNWGTHLNTTDNPDNGVVGSPGTYANTMTVASVENWKLQRYYIDIDGYKVAYNESSNGYYIPPVTTLTGEYQVVAVPGYGEAADYVGLDVTGKVVLVQRGVTSFAEKHAAAEAAGAVALLVYNNNSEEFGMDMTGSTCRTPAVSISMADGEYLLSVLAENPEITISFPSVYAPFPSPTAYQMSDFSSVGPAPDLTLAPDITAPGGNIYSTINNGEYGLMSGTSMAAPNIAGLSAIVMQYVKANFPESTDYRAITQNLLMSTSVPLLYADTQVPYSPRSQGSGLANAFNAVTSTGYLTVDGADNVKVDMGDDADRTGIYTYSFNVHNFGTNANYYRLHTNAQTEGTVVDQGVYFMSGTPYALEAATTTTSSSMVLTHDINGDGLVNTLDAYLVYQAQAKNTTGWENESFRYDLDANEAVNVADVQAYLDALVGKTSDADLEDQVLQVKPGAQVQVDVKIELAEADREYLDTIYVNGGYVEGFTFLTALQEDGVDLSLPYLGFYGSWAEPPIMDSASYTDLFTDGEATYNQYLHVLFTQFQGDEYGMYPGLNPYIDEPFDIKHAALSPNGDGMMDSISDIYISLMRNAETLKLSFSDMDTEELYFGIAIGNVSKSVYYSSFGSVIPFAYDLFISSPELYDWKGLENNTHVLFRAEAEGVAEGDLPETWEVPITVDLEAPELLSADVVTDPETGKTLLNLSFRDNQYVAALVLLNSNNQQVYAQNGVEDPEPGADGYRTYTYTYDISEISGKLVLAICDYAANESFYALNAAGAGEPYGDLVAYQYNYFMGTNGWVSFDKNVDENEVQISTDDSAIVAAEYVNGYVFVQDEAGNLYGAKYEEFLDNTMAPNLTFITQLENVYQDLAYNYTDGKLYGLLTYEENMWGSIYPTTSIYSINMNGAYFDEDTWTDVPAYGETWVAQYGSIYGLTMAIDDTGTFYIMAKEYVEAYDEETYEDISYYTDAQLWAVVPELVDIGWGEPYLDYIFEKRGDTNLGMDFLQSMTWDHNDEKLYWARFYVEGWDLYDELIEVDPATGACTVIGNLSGETFALFAPLTADSAAKPEHSKVPEMDPDVIPTPILRDSVVTMSTGTVKLLVCDLDPWYTNHRDLIWTSSDESVVTVNENGLITAVAAGSAEITVASAEDETKFDTVTVEVTALTLNFQGIVTNQGAGVGASMGASLYEFSMDAGLAQMIQKNPITAPENMNYGLQIATSEMGRGYIWACEYGNTGMVYKIDPTTGEVVDFLEPIDGDMLFGMHYSEAMDSFTAIMNMYLYVDQPFDSWAEEQIFDSYDENYSEFMWRKLDMLPYLIESNTGFITGEDGNGASSEIVFCGITGIDGGIKDSYGETYYYDTYKDYLGNWAYGGMMNYQPTQTLILLDNVGRIWYIDEIAGMTKEADEWGNVFLTDDKGSEIMYEGEPRNGMIELEVIDPEGNVSYSVFNIRQITETPMTQMFRDGTLPRITYHFSDIEFAGYTQDNDPMLAISMYDYWNGGTTNELFLFVPGHVTDEMDYETWEPIRTPDRLYTLGNTGDHAIIASIHSATVTGGIDPEQNAGEETTAVNPLAAGVYKRSK